jgi:hypothetical protein
MSTIRRQTGAAVVAIACAAAAALLACSGARAQDGAAADWLQPQTPWGEPDIRGMWPIGHLTGTPLQRPEAFGDRELLTDEEYAERASRLEAAAARYENEDSSNKMGMGHWAETGDPNRRTSLITSPANGRIPALTEEGRQISDAMRSSWHDITWDWVTDFDSWDRCITRGMPASMLPFMYNNGIEIFQSPGYVVLNLEMVHEARIIPTDGMAALPSQVEHWMGESRGRWEGNTLVIETTNLKAGPSVTNIGTTGSPPANNTPVTPNAKIVERLTMTSPDAIAYEVTYEDPTVFTAPWTAKLDWVRDDAYGMFEYACHEGQYMIRDYISAYRAGQAAAADGAGE